MLFHPRLFVRLSRAFVLLALPGCLPFQTVPAPTKPPTALATPAKQVKVGGGGLQLGDVQQAAINREEFARRTGELLNADRTASARAWVERYPDVALDTLRQAGAPEARSGVLQFIAQVHHEQASRAEGTAGWPGLLKQRAAQPDSYTAYDACRRSMLEKMAKGQAKEAAAERLSVPRGTPGPLLTLDAQQLEGEAWLLAERPENAVRDFSTALKAGQATHPYRAVQLLLLRSEAHRRAGKEDQAVADWQEAANLATTLLALPRPVCDPVLWERISYLRPVKTPWSAELGQALLRLDPSLGVPAPPPGASAAAVQCIEAQLWTCIGNWRLERHESQAALIAFKRAETFSMDHARRALLQLAQAQALTQLGQGAPARAVLAKQADSQNPAVAQPALAMLGALKFHEGNLQQGLQLLKKAVEPAGDADWPGRAAAEADLGLAYLSAGDEAAGLRWLRSAQQRFEQAGRHAQLIQALENEAAWFEHNSKPGEALSLKQRVQALESAAPAQS